MSHMVFIINVIYIMFTRICVILAQLTVHYILTVKWNTLVIPDAKRFLVLNHWATTRKCCSLYLFYYNPFCFIVVCVKKKKKKTHHTHLRIMWAAPVLYIELYCTLSTSLTKKKTLVSSNMRRRFSVNTSFLVFPARFATATPIWLVCTVTASSSMANNPTQEPSSRLDMFPNVR